MLHPILEIYVVWHPQDDLERDLMLRLLEHFHGNAYAGLLGGAIEVFARTTGWRDEADAPRPIPQPGGSDAIPVPAAELTAVVVLAGLHLARAIEPEDSPWGEFLSGLARQQSAQPDRLRVFPVRPASGAAPDACRLQTLMPGQAIVDSDGRATCRDLAQGLAQWAAADPTGAAPRLEVFISHTKHDSDGAGLVARLIAQVRERIDDASKLSSFFDANALQPGEDWDAALRTAAAGNALLALRTDLYASREWCQREMLLAKRYGLPVVVLDAPIHGESRGSFLMDHVIRTPIRREGDGWLTESIDISLALLVDACLQRALWLRQQRLTREQDGMQFDWWAPHAPEPATLVDWIGTQELPRSADAPALRILHPDPPLGPEERSVLDRIAHLAGATSGLDIMTPRLLAARGA